MGLRVLYNKNDFSMSEDLGYYQLQARTTFYGHSKALSLVKNRIGNKKAYLTFDIDFIDPAFAPGTGTPEAGRFTGYDAISLYGD